MYSAKDVARYVLGYYCFKRNFYCSNLKLQRILYFLQANHLIITGKPLFYEEIEAKDFGPVIRSVYFEYRAYGGGLIPFYALDNKDWDRRIQKKDTKIMDPFLDKLENYSSTTLLELIQNQTPWEKAYESYDDHIIKKEDLIDFFKEKED